MNVQLELEARLFNAGIVAIPLKHQDDCDLNPQPNFLIVDNTFDKLRQDFPDGKGGMMEDVACRNTALKLVYRNVFKESETISFIEELEFNVNGGRGMFNQIIPKILADVVDEGHKECIENEVIINTFLPLLRFKGMLSSFKMEYDVERSKRYLEIKEELKAPVILPTVPIVSTTPPPMPEPIIVPKEIVVENIEETPLQN